MLLEGKKALVTGSRRGIGRSIALILADEGADVGINDVERDQSVNDTMDMVRASDRNVSWHKADIANNEEVTCMVDNFIAVHGRIDILINNAVASVKKPFLQIEEEDWDFEVGNALKGYFLCSQRVAKEMVGQGGGGSIVSISSIHAYRAFPNDTVYGVCKAGLIRMAKSMAVDLAGHNIRSNCIAPGYIDSRLISPEEEHLRGGDDYLGDAKSWVPIRRGGLPQDVAGAVVFLCSRLGDYVNGECITVDGGFLSGGTPPGV